MKISTSCLTRNMTLTGAIDGVTLVRLNELYSLTMLTFAGSCLTGAGGTPVGGGGGGGSPPIAPIAPCSGIILPASASCNWFMNK